MFILQNTLLPEDGFGTEPELYFRCDGDVAMESDGSALRLEPGARVFFDTFMNLFSVAKWMSACELDGLCLELEGRGAVEAVIVHVSAANERRVLEQRHVAMSDDDPKTVDISHALDPQTAGGVLVLELRATGPSPVVFRNARFATRTEPDQLPALAISITTFRREDQLRKTLHRLSDFLMSYEHSDRINLRVVDNGQSSALAKGHCAKIIPNPNYGGAGGFARGLIEAEDAGDTHCLFMDDDASFHMENIVRTFAFLALATDASTAVVGAMIAENQTSEMWEYGAVFDGSCKPLHIGTDLTDPDEVIEMEFDSIGEQPKNFYGGWWFFAFPIASVKYHPFPFFVRGDDISFSLMNPFRLFTLSGVVSLQEDFGYKENPLTLYLDLRNHLVQHLVTEDLSRSGWGTARVALFFIFRSMVRLHYDTARAQMLAWKDVMKGPAFFAENLDLSKRRQAIADLASSEFWHETKEAYAPERRRIARWPVVVRRWLAFLTLNGHLLPFSGRIFDRLDIGIEKRNRAHTAFGAAELRFFDASGRKSYRVKQSKSAFFGLLREMARMTRSYISEHEALKADYRRAYPELASRSFWEEHLRARPSSAHIV